MSAKDFFDDDLLQKRDQVFDVKVEPELGKDSTIPMATAGRTPSISGLPPARLSKYMEKLDKKVSSASEELDILQRRQNVLEKEKASLEKLRSDQSRYLNGKKELITGFETIVVSMQREEIALLQRSELITALSKRSKELLDELNDLNDENWPEDPEGFQRELDKALVVIDELKKELGKSVAHLGLGKDSDNLVSIKKTGRVFDEFVDEPDTDRSFWFWLKAGFAATLPILIALIVLCIIILNRRGV
ncbi:MAG: hypothetical protein GX811_10250 [Lentisphaerae bacterium]|nr:hypothetical protein [Lentisphaerota bacterium]